MNVLLGLVLLAYFGFALRRAFRQADRAALKRWGQRLFGLAVLAAAVASGLHGQLLLALPLGLLGFWCLGQGVSLQSFRFAPRPSRRTGVSRMRSAMIEMEFDHGTSVLSGSVLAGKFEGRPLDDLLRSECFELHHACLFHDGGGARLLEAYLDRRFAGWRAAGKGEANPRRNGEIRSRPGAMSQDEAYEILGLRQGAGRQDIVLAHRTLIKKWHPDHGGSTDLAARVNEAKEVLLRRHT